MIAEQALIGDDLDAAADQDAQSDAQTSQQKHHPIDRFDAFAILNADHHKRRDREEQKQDGQYDAQDERAQPSLSVFHKRLPHVGGDQDVPAQPGAIWKAQDVDERCAHGGQHDQ